MVVPIYFLLDLCEDDSCPYGQTCRKDGFGFVCEITETSTLSSSLQYPVGGISTLGYANDPSLCDPGYYGFNCGASVCDDHICENGSCIITNNGTADCDCEKDFDGFYCEIDLRRCGDGDQGSAYHGKNILYGMVKSSQ